MLHYTVIFRRRSEMLPIQEAWIRNKIEAVILYYAHKALDELSVTVVDAVNKIEEM